MPSTSPFMASCLWFSLVLCVLFGCSQPELGAACEEDDDCHDSLFCEHAPIANWTCKRHCAFAADCAGLGSGVFCARRGTCERPCGADADCPFGGICNVINQVCERPPL